MGRLILKTILAPTEVRALISRGDGGNLQRLRSSVELRSYRSCVMHQRHECACMVNLHAAAVLYIDGDWTYD